MAELSVQDSGVDSPVNPVSFSSAASGGDTIPNSSERVILLVDNTDTSSHDVTVATEHNCSYGFDHDVTVSVSAGDLACIGPFDVDRYSDPVNLTYSAVTGMNVAAVKVPETEPDL